MKIARIIHYHIAWWRWCLHSDMMPSYPWLGKTRKERNRNVRFVQDRHFANEPKPEDYGLERRK